MNDRFDLAVVGGGIAGHVAAGEAAQQGLRVLHCTGTGLPGGLVANIGELLEFAAAPGALAGAELVDVLARQGQAAGVVRIADDAGSLERLATGFELVCESGRWQAEQVIAATGAMLRPLTVPGAERFADRGVLHCAWCNAGLFRGRRVVVVGAGDSALQEALHLARHAAAVIVLVRNDRLRARPSLASRAADLENIEFRWDTELLSIEGGATLEAVVVRDRFAPDTERIDCDAVFAYTGLAPCSAWLGDLVERDANGAVLADAGLLTRTPGLFVVGALRSGYPGRLAIAVGEATLAAISATQAAHDKR